MTQTHRELAGHVSFQLSLLRLATLPGPGTVVSGEGLRVEVPETKKLEELVETLVPVNGR